MYNGERSKEKFEVSICLSLTLRERCVVEKEKKSIV